MDQWVEYPGGYVQEYVTVNKQVSLRIVPEIISGGWQAKLFLSVGLRVVRWKYVLALASESAENISWLFGVQGS